MLQNVGMYIMDTVASTPTSAFNSTQLDSVKTALTSSAQTILQTFIDLLPIVALIVGVCFGIHYVSGRFSEVKHAN